MKKVLIYVAIAAALLAGCKKKEAPRPEPQQVQQSAPQEPQQQPEAPQNPTSFKVTANGGSWMSDNINLNNDPPHLEFSTNGGKRVWVGQGWIVEEQ